MLWTIDSPLHISYPRRTITNTRRIERKKDNVHVHARSTIGLLFFFFSRLDNEPTVEKANSIMMREQIARINGVKRARAQLTREFQKRTRNRFSMK